MDNRQQFYNNLAFYRGEPKQGLKGEYKLKYAKGQQELIKKGYN